MIYEAPHHLLQTLKELHEVLGDRCISVCRELTKKFEEVIRSSLENLILYYQNTEPRGEYVLIIEGKSYEDIERESRKEWLKMRIQEHMEYYEKTGVSRKEAMKLVALDRGISKRDVYRELLNKD